jgi:transposase InsO family protein
MATRPPLTPAERQHIYRAKLRGCTLPEIAAELNCSLETVRKWWRHAREHGRSALALTQRGRPPTGILSHFAPSVITHALALKRANPRWGPDRVRVELQHQQALYGLALPSRSRLALLFKTECPECVGLRRPKQPPVPAPSRPTAVHECWQLDMQEGIHLANGRVATICTIRDVVGAAILTSQAFDVTNGRRYRKLRWQEVRQVIRNACTGWETLPDAIQTDNEVCLAGQPSDPLPSQLTLWLIGLGVVHRFSRPRQPTDQAQIERTHRTLSNFAHLLDRLPDLATLQQRLDLEREQYNHWFPSRASDCARRPPLVAHPELKQGRRPYRVEWERQLFNEQQVYDYLATIGLSRKVTQVGQIQLGGRSVGVGRAYAGQTVTVGCDPVARQWVVRMEDGTEVARLPIQGVDMTTLSGISDEPLMEPSPIQLTLPCFVA